MERIAFLLKARPGYEEEYVRRHREVWPEVLADMEKAGLHKMSIFMQGRDLFLYMEVENYAEASRILLKSPESVRWEEYMTPILEDPAGGDYDPVNAFPDGLPEVFFWQAGEQGRGTNRSS
ncbi:MAG: L-rhamnose mutarotase [Candidatus Latescibacterota bacterium]|nr:L-rhamnose mutarotase [Candidatus Latescibacterota bacterium]